MPPVFFMFCDLCYQKESQLYRRCFPVRMLIETECFAQHSREDAQCAPLRRGLVIFGQLRKNSAIFCNTDSLPPDVISTKWSEAERVEKSPRRGAVVPCQGDFSAKSLRDFALRAPLEMTYGGNNPTVQNSSTLPIQPVGACIASPLCRGCFPVRV